MRAYAGTTECRMQFLRRQLDDPEAAPCGRCDNCIGVPMPTDVSAESLAAAQTALGRPGVEIEPRRMWPTGLPALGVDLSGRIPVELQADSGRALGRLSDVGWGSRLRDVFAAADGDVPDDVLHAVVQVLAGWGWEARPTGIVAVPSRSRPRLVDSLATRLAQVGRLPLLGTLERGHDTPRRGGSNSAQRLLAVHDSLVLPPAMKLDGSPVLLVDDRLDTGWTVTEAARLLREGGAGHVLPLVLGVEA
jgi:ATP-dependent DNA helicase RecQ